MSAERFTVDYRAIPTESLRPKSEAIFHSVETSPGQIVRLIEVDARPKGEKTGRTIIWPATFQARVQHDNAVRMQTLASQLEKSRILFVETPGVTIDPENPLCTSGHTLTNTQETELRHGNFRAAAAAQIKALQEVVGFKQGDEVELVGYSMGASSAAYIARELGQQPFGEAATPSITRIDFLDAVNDQPWRLYQLRKNILKEGRHNKQYIDENRQQGFDIPKYGHALESIRGKIDRTLLWHQRTALRLSGSALRNAFAPVLVQAIEESRGNNTTRLDEAVLTFYRAEGSLVGRREAHEQTSEDLRRVGHQLRLVELTGAGEDDTLRHLFPRSLGRIAHFANQCLV